MQCFALSILGKNIPYIDSYHGALFTGDYLSECKGLKYKIMLWNGIENLIPLNDVLSGIIEWKLKKGYR